MLNGRYTNVDEVLERLRRDYGFEDVVKDEIKEWIWDAVGIIGCVEALQDKIVTIDIENWRGLLPEDFYSLESGGIREYETNIPLIQMTDTHYLNQPSVVSEDPAQYANEHTYYQTHLNIEDVDNEYGFQIGVPSVRTNQQYTYKIKDWYIYTGKEIMTVEMSYQAFPLSDDGTPAIPDDPKYIRAIVSYCAFMIARRLKFKNEMARDDFNWISDEYSWAVASAKTKIKMPSIDQMEAIKNRSIRLIPNINEHRDSFRSLPTKERLKGS